VGQLLFFLRHGVTPGLRCPPPPEIPWGAGRPRRAPPAHHLRPAMTELYWISLMMLNIGMYRATTAAPTHPPMTAIRIGSINEVRASTDASTS
jgi:hypothetical protein